MIISRNVFLRITKKFESSCTLQFFHFEIRCHPGRSDEVNEIKQLLQTIKSNDALGTSNTRFVSIEGEGGIGKTRILEEIMDVAEDEDYK